MKGKERKAEKLYTPETQVPMTAAGPGEARTLHPNTATSIRSLSLEAGQDHRERTLLWQMCAGTCQSGEWSRNMEKPIQQLRATTQHKVAAMPGGL